MDWTALMQMIIAIITVIMELIGGGQFDRALVPDQQVAYHLASYQWSCGSSQWAVPGNVQNGVYSGTVLSKCEIEGTNGGGIVALRNHLVEQISRNSSHIFEGPVVKNYNGLPSHAYDHSVVVATNEQEFEMRGETNIATNGFTELKSVFRATSIPTNNSLHYLKGMEDEISVSASNRAGWYTITLKTTTSVAKPWFLSGETFTKAMNEKLVEKMENRRERVMNDLASKL